MVLVISITINILLLCLLSSSCLLFIKLMKIYFLFSSLLSCNTHAVLVREIHLSSLRNTNEQKKHPFVAQRARNVVSPFWTRECVIPVTYLSYSFGLVDSSGFIPLTSLTTSFMLQKEDLIELHGFRQSAFAPPTLTVPPVSEVISVCQSFLHDVTRFTSGFCSMAPFTSSRRFNRQSGHFRLV